MRIQISGGHGMGKTTLAKRLARVLNVPYVSLDPIAFSSVKPLNYDNDVQKKFVLWQILEQCSRPNAVFDRGPEDGVAYGLLLGLLDRDEALELLHYRPRDVTVVVMTKKLVDRDFPIDPRDVSAKIIELCRYTGVRYVLW